MHCTVLYVVGGLEMMNTGMDMFQYILWGMFIFLYPWTVYTFHGIFLLGTQLAVSWLGTIYFQAALHMPTLELQFSLVANNTA